MTIPSKGSRKIKFEDKEYAWYIRKKPSYEQALAHSNMCVAIQSREDAACVLLVDLGVSRPDSWLKPHQTALKPAVVRDIIATALRQGWQPSKAGGPFTLQYQLIHDRP